MSYILEALKKSERERGHGVAPGIQTVHSSSLNYHVSKRSLWPWILITAVMLNLVALAYFAFNNPEHTGTLENSITEESSAQVVTTTGTQAAEKPVVNNISIDSEAAPSQRSAQIALPATTAQTPGAQEFRSQASNRTPEVNAPQPSESNTRIELPISMQAVDIMQLPDDIRAHIPNMEFSAHVYSSNPMQRSVVINGRFMEEGERMNEDFILKEITSTGVIMDFKGYLFHTNVITGWNTR